MKTVYIYLSRNNYTEEHVNHMTAMLGCLGSAGELWHVHEGERADLYSVEIKAEASPWAVEFLEHMSDCDMLCVLDEPIEIK